MNYFHFGKKDKLQNVKRLNKNDQEIENEVENENEGKEHEETASNKISAIIREILDQSEKKLSLFQDTGLNQALDDFVNKQESSSIKDFVASAVDEMKRTLRKDKTKNSQNQNQKPKQQRSF